MSIFANVLEKIRWFWREGSLLTMKFIWRFSWILKRKVYLENMNNLPKHHGAGPQRRWAQCSCIGCIGLRPALSVVVVKRGSTVFWVTVGKMRHRNGFSMQLEKTGIGWDDAIWVWFWKFGMWRRRNDGLHAVISMYRTF